jgi:putative DNA primase/helicase
MSRPSHVVVAETVLRAVRFSDERSRIPEAWQGPVLELVGGTHQLRAQKKGTPAFSPVVYGEGATRGKAGVVEITALVLDFDHLSADAVTEVHSSLADRGWAWLAYSSFSHHADDACFRLLLFVSRPIEPGEYEAVWAAANGALGGFADRNARDISRVWYVAACPPERATDAWLRHGDGRPLDVDGAVRALEQQRRRNRRKDRGSEETGQPIHPGERNSQLMSLAGAMRRRGADLETIRDALVQTNRARCRPPLDDKEVARISESAVRYDPPSVLLAANRTDLGNAERFAAFAGDRFRYVHAWSSWLFFDGKRWVKDADGGVVRWCRDMLRAMAVEARAIQVPEERGPLEKHALDSESSHRVTATCQLARALLPISNESLDQQPDLFNCVSGTVDLRTGRLQEHNRDHLMTRLAPVAHRSDTICPRWDDFLLRCMGGDPELVGFLQRAVGYSLTGHTSEQVLFMLYGTGANGKSTFLETLRALLGDYATQADFTTFLKREGEGVRNDLARLVGTRLVSAVEAEAGAPLAEALVKQVTGGDIITARFLFREFFEFRPTFKLWLAANHKPTVRGTDHGIWRRIRLVPFTVTIPKNERDPQLLEKLRKELPGILAWAVRGAVEWRERGLAAPSAVQAATDSYQSEMDTFGGFVADCCVEMAGELATAKELYEAYQVWCEANAERPRSKKALAMGLRERGFESARTKKARGWAGLRLRSGLLGGDG